jgi:hypothetical protein
VSDCPICQRRPPDRPLVCEPDRAWLARVLREIPDLYAALDPADGAMRSSGGPKVSGTTEAPVPVDLELVDLTAPARAGSLLPHANGAMRQQSSVIPRTKTLELHAYAAVWSDQIGGLSVATTLDSWARDWREQRHRGETMPVPTVLVLAGWLGDRLGDACDSHPAVDEFAADMRDLHRRLRGALGLLGPWPELCDGVPCRCCDTRSLYRVPGSDYVECATCPELMTEDEYHRWTELLAASARRGAAA